MTQESYAHLLERPHTLTFTLWTMQASLASGLNTGILRKILRRHSHPSCYLSGNNVFRHPELRPVSVSQSSAWKYCHQWLPVREPCLRDSLSTSVYQPPQCTVGSTAGGQPTQEMCSYGRAFLSNFVSFPEFMALSLCRGKRDESPSPQDTLTFT